MGEIRYRTLGLLSRTSAVLFVAIFVYVLSYAPIVRIREGADTLSESDDLMDSLYGTRRNEYPLYRPIDWSIGNTPLREPLLIWADVWSVRERFELGTEFTATTTAPRGGSYATGPVKSSTPEGGRPLGTTSNGEQDASSPWTETAEVVFENGSPWVFGDCVSASGDRILVGATEVDGNLSRCSAYFFERQPDASWQQSAKVTISNAAESIMCKSVSLSGDRALVGATDFDKSDSGFGAVYVFERRSEGSWQQTAKLRHPHFGTSVAVDGNLAIVGAPGEDARGKAYIFEHQADGTWLQIAGLTPNEDTLEQAFGVSVSMTPECALVGVESQYLGNGSDGGLAYVFDHQSNGTWKESARLIASDRAHDSALWTRVSLSGSQALVGVNWSSGQSVVSGAAYVFERGDDGTWRQTATLIPSSATTGAFVVEVSLSDGRALVGSYGYTNYSRWTESASIFERQIDGDWRQTHQLVADDGAGEYIFGASVILDGGRAFIGAPRDIEGNGISPGAVYVFEESGR